MDIKQMKNFVSQELKGLKQEHRLLSLRRCQLGVRVEVTVPPVGNAEGLCSQEENPGRWRVVISFGPKWEEVVLDFALR